MPNEIAFQRQIIAGVKKGGGFGRKWASDWTNGVPDLILVHPRFGTIFSEVKKEDVKTKTGAFKRTLDFTVLQQGTLGEIYDAGGCVINAAVVYYGRADALLVLLPPGVYRLSDVRIPHLINVKIGINADYVSAYEAARRMYYG